MDRMSYYTDGQVKEIIKSLIFLVDTREKENSHITEYFEKSGINYKKKALESGDYSVLIPVNEKLGILTPQTFNKPIDGGIYIERKNSLEELSSNLGRNREQFESELERMKGAEKHLIIENGNWRKIMKGMYNSEVTAASYYGSLMTFQTRYGVHIHFIEKDISGALIKGILRNKVKEYFRL